MDVSEADQEVINSWKEWIQHHQERLQLARNLAWKNLEEAAEYRQQHHNNQVHDRGLSKGQLIYLKDHRHQGRHKSQDVWSPVLYKVVNVPDKPGAPYTVTLVDGASNAHRVHRTEMRAARLEDQPCEPVIPQPCPQAGAQEGELDSEEEDYSEWPTKEKSILSVDSFPEGAYHVLTPGREKSVQEADSDAQGDVIPVSDGLEQEILQPHSHQASCQQEMPQPQDEMLTLRRTSRPTAGQHSNPYHLPQSAVTSFYVGAVGAAAFTGLNQANPFRPWL